MKYYTLLIPLLILVSCATSEPVSEDDRESDTPTILDFPKSVLDNISDRPEPADAEDLDELETVLMQTRSYLEDRFPSISHDLPDSFLQKQDESDVESDPYAGFRIQILSTRNVQDADTLQSQFNTWADSTFSEYSPHSYIYFRQPYYRVRVGDFQDRDRAIELSRVLKEHYPDAWVVHAQINPFRIPADSVGFHLREPDERAEEPGSSEMEDQP